MCCEVPLPAEPKAYLSGLALSSATNSRTLAAGTLGCTSSTLGWVAYRVMGAKLVAGSYGSLSYSVALIACELMVPPPMV